MAKRSVRAVDHSALIVRVPNEPWEVHSGHVFDLFEFVFWWHIAQTLTLFAHITLKIDKQLNWHVN